MGKIVDFPSKNEGYTYFAKRIIDSICEGIPEAEDFKVIVYNEIGKPCRIDGVRLEPKDKTIILYLERDENDYGN